MSPFKELTEKLFSPLFGSLLSVMAMRKSAYQLLELMWKLRFFQNPERIETSHLRGEPDNNELIRVAGGPIQTKLRLKDLNQQSPTERVMRDYNFSKHLASRYRRLPNSFPCFPKGYPSHLGI